VKPAIHHLAGDRSLAEQTVGHGQPPQAIEAKRHQRRGHAAGKPRDVGKGSGGALRRHVVERLTRADSQPRDSVTAAAADQELRPAPVVHHERHLAQVEALDELAQDLDDAAHRQVSARAHRLAVGAEGQGRQHAAVVPAEICDHVAPLRAVHDQAVDEHHHRSRTAGVLVLDLARRQLHPGHYWLL